MNILPRRVFSTFNYLPPGLTLDALPPQRLPSEALSLAFRQPPLPPLPETNPSQDTIKNDRLIVKLKKRT